jgi:AraC-like DNA-binding protein
MLGQETATMKKASKQATPKSGQVNELRLRLGLSIASLIGDQENLTTAIPGLQMFRRTAPTAPYTSSYEPSLAVVAQGRKRADLGGTTFIFDESRYLLTSLDLPVISQVVEASGKRPYLCFFLKLEIPIVRELLSHEEIHRPEAPSASPAMATGETTPELLEACCRLVELLNTPQDIPVLSGLIQREIIYRILRGPEGARLRQISTLGDQSQRTAKAIAWVKANFAKPLRVEALARIAGMGASTLHHHFRALTAMSPLQYQKQLRLQAARERMLMDRLDAASAAFAVGYESASQFNREYSRMFGKPPMRDIQTLRLPDAPPSEPISIRQSAS